MSDPGDRVTALPQHPQVRFVPPARRATDAYLGFGFSAMAGLAWIATVRVALLGETLVALLYGVCAVMATIAAVGIVRLVLLYRLQKRRRRSLSHHE